MKTAIRFKKARSWLQDNVCNKCLFCSVLLYQATLSTIGRLFHDASIVVDANVVPWCLDATNPAALTMNKIAGLLTNLLGANLRVRRLGSRDNPHDGHRHVQLIGRFGYTVRVDIQRVAVASWQD